MDEKLTIEHFLTSRIASGIAASGVVSVSGTARQCLQIVSFKGGSSDTASIVELKLDGSAIWTSCAPAGVTVGESWGSEGPEFTGQKIDVACSSTISGQTFTNLLYRELPLDPY
jgi:hypothetical protein